MNFESPLVSVIVRTKDRPGLLREALESLKSQKYKHLEVVVVNDGGCEIGDIISRFKTCDFTIKLCNLRQNMGRSAAGNAGLDASSGKYMIFLDDDDWFEHQHIELLVNALRTNGEYLAAYTGVRFCESPGAPDIHIFNDPFDPVYLMLENTIPLHALMFDSSLVEEYGCQFDEQFSQFEDWDLWLQFSCITDFFHVDQVSAGYRSGGDSDAGWGEEEGVVTKARQKLLKKWKSVWDEEKLDQAFRWSRKIRYRELEACRDELGRAMESHKILHEEHEKLLVATTESNKAHESLSDQHNVLITDHRKLEVLHGNLISDYQRLENLHTALIEDHQKLEGFHTALIEGHQKLEDFHTALIEDHQKLEGFHTALIEDHQRLEGFHTALIEDHQNLKSLYDDLNISYQALEESQGALTNEHKKLMDEHGRLLNENRILKNDNIAYARDYETLKRQFNSINAVYNEIINSKCWRYTKYVRVLGNQLKRSKSFMLFYTGLRSSVLLCRRIYANYIRKGYSIFRFKWKRLNLFNWYSGSSVPVSGRQTSSDQNNNPGYRIGIAAHIFYPDLFEELCSFLNNIPVKYHLFLSVTSDKDKEYIRNRIDRIKNEAVIVTKVVPNRGRDIAPVLVAFRDELRRMDIISHVHTKKSDYTGSAQFGNNWRSYLLNSLMGSRETVRSILDLFAENPDVGIIYPETFSGLPCWAHTWLSNRNQGEKILNRLGYDDVDFSRYIDYPAGSMFWVRTGAIAPLFDLDLTMDDFPAETGQTDDTLHHAIERCFVFSAHAAGFQHRFIADAGSDKSRHGPVSHGIEFKSASSFVIDQYAGQPFDEKVKGFLTHADVISFDIFDTLLIRPFADPDAVFYMLEEKIEKQFGIKKFFTMRKMAENLLRRTLRPGKDLSLSQIYEKMGIEYQIDEKVIKKLQSLEIETEGRLLEPRPAVVDFAKAVKEKGKRVILISDMYLEPIDIKRFLKKYNLDMFDAVYLSSGTGLRKDNGTMWPYVLEMEKVSRGKFLHIGDNEQSDIQILVDKNFLNPVHIFRPVVFLDNIKGGRSIVSVFRNRRTWQNELMLGLIANKVTQRLDRNPFNHETVFQDPYLFGYAVTGPIVFSFMAWLIKKVIEKNHSVLLFLSREGWVLNVLYNKIITHLCMAESELNLPEGRYFYCSRTFMGLAAIDKPDDLNLLLSSHYSGTFEKLLTGKFGITELSSFVNILGKDKLAREVSLPGDYEMIFNDLAICMGPLTDFSCSARDRFRQYWAKIVEGRGKDPAIIDIGYSGTIQKAMMKVLNSQLTGYYFITNSTAQSIVDSGGKCEAYYGSMVPLEKINELIIHRYSLLLEAVLTSPEGQMAGLKKDLTPVFKPGGISQHNFEVIKKTHKGIIDFSTDILNVTGPDFVDIIWEKDCLHELVSLVIDREIDIGSLASSLFVEDDFSGNGELPVLDFYSTANQGVC